MTVRGQSFAFCAEICIMANSAFIPITHNARVKVTLAQGTITVDAVVALCVRQSISYGLKNGNEAMPRMLMASSVDATRAIVPVRTVQAFVTYAVNVL